MAHLWVRSGDSEWAALELAGDLVLDDRVLPAKGSFDLPDDERPAHRVNHRTDHSTTRLVGSATDPARWALLALPGRATVNGIPVMGLRVLRDRDEIRLVGLETAYFSTERLTSIQPCAVSNASIICPRCRQPIASGTPAVCCPACGVWHHQETALACWTYAERCALCPQPTGLDAGYQWTPEAL